MPDTPRVTIQRQYEVECRENSCDRVIDVPRTYADAVAARRQHLEDHRTGSIDQPEPLGVVR